MSRLSRRKKPPDEDRKPPDDDRKPPNDDRKPQDDDRKFQNSYRKPPRARQITNDVISTPIHDKKIFQRAISSANKHGIHLEPGRENNGYGNCSYEATIFNINDRSCFAEKLPMSPDFYRRIWNTDMMNRIIYEANEDWNPGLSRAQLRQGFAELTESGVYERPFFGDMMMAGIACGVKKRWGDMVPRDNLPRDNVPQDNPPRDNLPRRQSAPEDNMPRR